MLYYVSQQLLELVIYKAGVALVVKTIGQRAREVGGEGAAGEIGHDLARTEVLKEQRLAVTVCR